MELINSSSFRLLDARTVISILNSKIVQSKKYPHIRPQYYTIKKTSDSKIFIFVKGEFSSNIERIYDNIAELFSTDVLLGGKKVFVSGENSNILGVDKKIILQRAVKKVEIFFRVSRFSQNKVPELDRPGILNEEYFVSKINDQVQKIKEAKKEVGMPNIFDPNLNLLLYENYKKKYVINGITSIERVGQDLGKSDVRIKTKRGSVVNISLKKENFSFWGSASTYPAAKNILDYLIKSNIISYSKNNEKSILTDISTGKLLPGIRVKATVNEIKKYCFGEDGNSVDYILIQSFSKLNFSEMRKTGGGVDYKFGIYSAIIYKEIANDIIRMRNDVYLTIVPSSKNSSSLLPEYPGFKIQFATEKASNKYYEPNLSGLSLGRL